MRTHFIAVFTLLLIISPVTSQAPPPPVEDQSKYYGYEYGCAGISVAALAALRSLNISDISSVTRCFDTIWNHRATHENRVYSAWPKSTESSAIYPGMKYGAVGILLALLELYQFTRDQVYLEYVKSGYSSLMDQALNKSTLPHWGYSYGLPKDPYAISITDLKYGSAGVLKLNLELYRITANETLLVEGRRIISWLQQTVKLVEAGDVKYSVIPWYDLEDPNKPVIAAYGLGLAGIVPLLHTYGMLLQDQIIINWAYEQAKFLQSTQFENGSWAYSFGGDLISNGLDEGVAGILKGLWEYQITRGTSEFDPTIRKGIDYLLSIIVDNGTHFGFPSSNRDTQFFNNRAHGLVGLLQVLIQLDDYLLENERATVVKGIEYLLSNASFTITHEGENLLFLRQPWLEERTLDFSFSDGQAGYLKFLTEIPQKFKSLVTLDTENAIESLLQTILVFQDKDGMWPKQRNLLPQVETNTFSQTKQSPVSSVQETPFLLSTSLIYLIIFLRKKKN